MGGARTWGRYSWGADIAGNQAKSRSTGNTWAGTEVTVVPRWMRRSRCSRSGRSSSSFFSIQTLKETLHFLNLSKVWVHRSCMLPQQSTVQLQMEQGTQINKSKYRTTVRDSPCGLDGQHADSGHFPEFLHLCQCPKGKSENLGKTPWTTGSFVEDLLTVTSKSHLYLFTLYFPNPFLIVFQSYFLQTRIHLRPRVPLNYLTNAYGWNKDKSTSAETAAAAVEIKWYSGGNDARALLSLAKNAVCSSRGNRGYFKHVRRSLPRERIT